MKPLPQVNLIELFTAVRACPDAIRKYKDLTPEEVWNNATEMDIDIFITKIFEELTPNIQSMYYSAFWYGQIKCRYPFDDFAETRYPIIYTKDCADAIRASISFRTIQAATRRWLIKQGNTS